MEWTDEQREAFGALWRAAREARGKKGYQVALETGLSHGTISALERGPFEGMRAIDLFRLGRYYGIPAATVEALVLGEPAAVDAEEHHTLEQQCAAALHALPDHERTFVLEVFYVLIRGLRQ